jgi:RNA polymerase sigma factor (sigma-70 family)
MSKVQSKQEYGENSVSEKGGSHYWSDDHLLRGCLDGKEEAWTALLEKYKNLIYSIPVKRGIPRPDAAEIFQSVCAELISELPKLRDPQALPGWLIKVTSHKCFHWQREQSRYNQPEPDAEQTTASTERGADNLLIELQNEQMLREAITKLPTRCRKLIHTLFYEDPPRPYKDVAEAFGIAVGSIGFIRGRCLEKLRVSLEASEFGTNERR